MHMYVNVNVYTWVCVCLCVHALCVYAYACLYMFVCVHTSVMGDTALHRWNGRRPNWLSAPPLHLRPSRVRPRQSQEEKPLISSVGTRPPSLIWSLLMWACLKLHCHWLEIFPIGRIIYQGLPVLPLFVFLTSAVLLEITTHVCSLLECGGGGR